MKKLILILLFPLNSQAQLTPSMTQALFSAWAKQTGFEQEAGQTGEALRNKIPVEIKKPLEIIVGIVDTINKQHISFAYKYEF